MATFAYRAVDQAGREVAGSLTADGRAAALDELEARGLTPVAVEDSAPAGARGRTGGRPGKVSRATVDAFTRELANLLAAGVSLSRALSILSGQAAHAAARRQWQAIHDSVADGDSLADALARWPASFPPVHVAMVRAGEAGGFLDLVLEQIAEFRSREQDLVGRVKAALVYPVVLAVLAAGVLAFLMAYFIPRFSGVFEEFGGALPWLTKAIVGASRFIVRNGLAIAAVVAVLVVVSRRALSSESGRRTFERMVLHTPGVGTVSARFALVRFCRMLGTLLGAGVPLIAALRVAKEAIGNQTLSDAVDRATSEVQQGSSLSASLAASPELFPPSVAEMTAVAEQTGRLDKEMVRLAASYEGDLDRRLRMLVALAEPALLFLMAALIGLVVIGMLLPVFTLQELIR
ncbi:MAG: type II secretion system F family protein [Candidatus Brocadiaceae bacterium]|nr:type II secretion system F family protein [Candidatus Brocadiaceae bacterium]